MSWTRAKSAGQVLLPGLCVLIAACSGSGDGVPSEHELLQIELGLIEQLAASPGRGEPGSFGADPHRILRAQDPDRLLVLTRGSSEILLVTSDFQIVDRRNAPRSPSGWQLVDDTLYVGGEHSSRIEILSVNRDKLVKVGAIHLEKVAGIRDLVVSGQDIYALDEFDRRLIHLRKAKARGWSDPEREDYELGAGPNRIVRVADYLVINLLLERELMIVPIQDGRPRPSRALSIRHDGPFWGVAATLDEDGLLIAATGVENRPLNRLNGEFGFVDSFLFLYHIPLDPLPGDHATQATAEVNLSELGLVTPRAIAFHTDRRNELLLSVAGFGTDRVAEFSVSQGNIELVKSGRAIPGVAELIPKQGREDAIIVSPLLDQLAVLGDDLATRNSLRVQSKLTPNPPSSVRLGELLHFTTLMAPHNRSEGELSRLTCETCHYEGGTDGRVHFTGREDIYASTKTLRGLSNNAPLFSRAGDRSLASMVLAEFRVANQGRRDVFELRLSDYPWLSGHLERKADITARQLREALTHFFVEFAHRTNPWRLQNERLDPAARAGLPVFRDRCEDCHQAVPSTRGGDAVPFEAWETWLTSRKRDLVWAAPFLSKAGPKPYVDPAGARVPSLRRVWQKSPLFIDGSARSVAEVLQRFRYKGTTALHSVYPTESDTGLQQLTDGEIDALKALMRYF